MNLLIDFITPSGITGAGEYHRRVVHELLKEIKNRDEVIVYALFDSRRGVAYDDLTEEHLVKNANITFVDCSDKLIETIVNEYSIDRFFIACAQYIGEYPGLEKLKCEIICVIHDLCDEDFENSHLFEYLRLMSPSHNFIERYKIGILNKLLYLKRRFSLLLKDYAEQNKIEFGKNTTRLQWIQKLVDSNPLVKLVTVSDYTKSAALFYHKWPEECITVLYSPERLWFQESEIENSVLNSIIDSRKKYFLLCGGNRQTKNTGKCISAFLKYHRLYSEYNLVVIGGMNGGDGIINLPYLSESDYQHALSNCYALVFPSFFEGFGYPPVEAMRYGKPVLCSNTTSMPEILGNAPIFFSPFYEVGIFDAFIRFSNSSYEDLVERSLTQWHRIESRQTDDLKKLLDEILYNQTSTRQSLI